MDAYNFGHVGHHNRVSVAPVAANEVQGAAASLGETVASYIATQAQLAREAFAERRQMPNWAIVGNLAVQKA